MNRLLLFLGFAALAAAQQQPDFENPVKKTLREGKPVVGMTVTVPSADVAVQAAAAGFDFLWIEMEHSAVTLESARNIIQATRGTRIVPFIRVPINEPWTAKRALDVGALGVVFPFTSTPELARQAVAACKYPPAGIRGAAPTFASLRWPAPGGYPDFADRNVMVIIIIEEEKAVENIDEILSVPGIDVAFIGPTDLSFSMGFRGRLDEPKHKAAIAKVVAAAKRRNIPVGRTAQGNIQEFLNQGFTFFQAPSELVLMNAGARPVLEAFGKKPPDPKERGIY